MNRNLVLLLPLLALAAMHRFAHGDVIEVRDDAGNVVTLEQPAARIVSLAPALTELLFAAGAGERLVGVIQHSDYPPAATGLPIVGRHDQLDMERIVQLGPDLIVAWQSGNPRASVERLRQLGLTVYVAEPQGLATIPSHLRRLAVLAGTQASAIAAISEFETRLASLNARYRHLAPVRTFYQLWDAPMITAGGNELLNDIIELCGGVNIFADIDLLAPRVSREAVLARNPVAIVASGSDRQRPPWLDDWKRWPGLTAAARDNLFFIPPRLLQRPTPRVLSGAEQLCQALETARRSL